VDNARDAALELGADGNDEAVAADGDEVFLGGAVRRELAQGGAEGFFNLALLAFLLAADAVEFGDALSASEPSGWMVRSMDSANGRREVVRVDDSALRPGSLRGCGPGRLEEGLQEATSLARRATAWSSTASRLRREFALWRRVALGRKAAEGMEICSLRIRRSSAVS